MIRAVIFDMDGLMFDTERLGIEAWQYAGACMGFEVPEWLPIAAIGRSKEDCEELIVQALSSPSLGGSGAFDGDEEDTATQPPALFDYERGCELFAKYMFEVIRAEGMPIKKGLVELLDYLDANEIPYTMATSSEPGTVGFYLTSAELDGRFGRIVSSTMVAHGKPAPDIFLEAARQLGFAPDECLVLEDSDAGITAAHAARCHAILIPDIKEVDDETRALADAQLEDLSQLVSWLEDKRREAQL